MPDDNQRAIPSVAHEYARKIRARLGPHARQVILFGSHARGDALPGSDYDFVVVVDRRTRQLREVVSDIGAALLNDQEALCATLIYDDAQWDIVQRSPLGWNIEREGIVI